VVAVPAGAPFHSARKQPSGSAARNRCQSSKVWFQPASARTESAKARSATVNQRTRSGEFMAANRGECAGGRLAAAPARVDSWLALSLEDQLPGQIGPQHLRAGDLLFRAGQQVRVEHDQVGQLAGLKRAELVVAT